MQPIDEMFVITILCISIVGLICIGLLILLGLCICKFFNKINIPLNPQNINQQSPAQTSDEKPEQGKGEEETILGTSVTIYGLAFAVSLYALSIIHDNLLRGLVTLVMSIILLLLGFPKSRKWVYKNGKRFNKVLWLIILLLLAMYMLSIYIVIPV